MLRYNCQFLDTMTVNDVGFDYTSSNKKREFKVLEAISNVADASSGRLVSGQAVVFVTTLSKRKCLEVISDLGLSVSSISVHRIGLFKREVTVRF